MSTPLTSMPEPESDAAQASPAPLGQRLFSAQQWVNISLAGLMARRGHDRLTPAHMMFLAHLDCGETHASAVARRLGVSRQAVYRTTRELQALGILMLENDPERGNQKIIQMTQSGKAVINDALACLREVEEALRARLGEREFAALNAALGRNWGPVLG